VTGTDFAEFSGYRFASLDPDPVMADEREGNSNDGQAPPPPRPHGGNSALGDRPELDRLPPPAFPPGERGAKYRRSPRASVGEPGPARPVGPEAGEAGVPDEAVVTGIGNDPHLGETDPTSPRYADPHVAGLVLHVGRLANALRDHGEAGLRTTADMNQFEATLRAYCVGYLVAQRKTGEE
jgi:hypothetical protein